MKYDLFPFQHAAVQAVRQKVATAANAYRQTGSPQVVSLTAPTGAGKTVIMSALIERILTGDEGFAADPQAIFIWLSDSPELNEQSRNKIFPNLGEQGFFKCDTVETSFDQEILTPGQIYFLNTQKLGKASNLTKSGDRNHTIWETLANTVREQSDHLYVIIDEAHRGMQGREAGRATTIMQKFLRGDDSVGLPPMPVVVGMSATIARFNRLIGTLTSTVYKYAITAADVRSSGLLKDRIIVAHPENTATNNDLSVLQAAADDWRNKCARWQQYCREQHYALFNPILVIQVANRQGRRISGTDMDACLETIEERTGVAFEKGEVVHAFGDTRDSLMINGLEVPYREPSGIADGKEIRVVLFKESLSTGWDCPRAETMMSFRRADDATYIAQLLGRMVRTPLQMHINVDDSLNEVRLYLPYFDEATVDEIVTALQNSEGGEIPADIYAETLGDSRMATLTVNNTLPFVFPATPAPQTPTSEQESTPGHADLPTGDAASVTTPLTTPSPATVTPKATATSQMTATAANDDAPATPTIGFCSGFALTPGGTSPADGTTAVPPPTITAPPHQAAGAPTAIARAEIVRFINSAGLLTYNVRSVRVKEYLPSLFALAHLVTETEVDPEAVGEITDAVLQLMRSHVASLRTSGKYASLAEKITRFELASRSFDVFGDALTPTVTHDLYTTIEADLGRQFASIDHKLGNEGLGIQYVGKYKAHDDLEALKIEVMVFALDAAGMEKLNAYAKEAFHALNDRCRRRMAQYPEEQKRRRYDAIVADGDVVSKHNYYLPATLVMPQDPQGRIYSNHLFAGEGGNSSRFKLNAWEEGVLAEEARQADFVCWIRNPPRKSWSLCIPYEFEREYKGFYPDFLIIRRETPPGDGFIVDVLEPHRANERDNLGKAQGLARYAQQHPGVGRIQLIRMESNVLGTPQFLRLDLGQAAVRERVLRAVSNDALDEIFSACALTDRNGHAE